MAGFLFLEAYAWVVRWIRSRLFKAKTGRLFNIGTSLLISLLLLAVYGSLLLAAGYWLSKVDPRMASLFNFSALKANPLFVYANQLVFAERLVFWQAGWEVFNDFPFFGVGLGNAGYFFPEKLSAFSWGLTEVSTLIFRWGSIPNIKSLWVRILAETGLVGMSFFAAWYFLCWISARALILSRERLSRMFGLAGCLVLAGLLVEGFNMDTFALPYLWLSLGLVTAACQRMRKLAYARAHQVVLVE
jgi:O-antigen ligase